MSVITPTSLVGARSPIYATAAYSDVAGSLTDVTLKVFIWNGARTSRPTLPEYTLFRDVFASTNVSFDLAPMVQEYLSNTYTGFDVTDVSNVPNNSIVWVQVDYIVNYINKADPPQTINDTGSSDIFEASNGYHTFIEGANKQSSTGFLHTTSTKYIKDSGNEILSAYIGEFGGSYDDLSYARFSNDGGDDVDFDLSSYLANTQAEGRVLTFPCGITNLTAWLITEGEPLNYITYYDIKLLNSAYETLDSVRIYPECEAKYSPNVVRYINRYGVWDSIYFFKASQDSFNTTSEQYRKSIGSPSLSGYSYDVTEELYKQFNTNGKTRTTLNTGWVTEDYKEAIKDLMMSERVMLNGKPTSVITNSVTLQKSINDKTINYTIEVEEAFDTRYV